MKKSSRKAQQETIDIAHQPTALCRLFISSQLPLTSGPPTAQRIISSTFKTACPTWHLSILKAFKRLAVHKYLDTMGWVPVVVPPSERNPKHVCPFYTYSKRLRKITSHVLPNLMNSQQQIISRPKTVLQTGTESSRLKNWSNFETRIEVKGMWNLGRGTRTSTSNLSQWLRCISSFLLLNMKSTKFVLVSFNKVLLVQTEHGCFSHAQDTFATLCPCAQLHKAGGRVMSQRKNYCIIFIWLGDSPCNFTTGKLANLIPHD